MSLFPSWTLCAGYASISELRAALGVPDDSWQCWLDQVGDPGEDIRLLAALPRVAIQSGCSFAQLAGSPLSPVQATQVGLVWRLARRSMSAKSGVLESEFVDVDPWLESGGNVPPGAGATSPASGSGTQLKEKVLKMSTLIDQQDESELVPVPNSTQESVAEDSGERKRRAQANRDKRMAKKKRARDDREELKRYREKPDNAKGRGKGKSKDQQGKAICFSWSSSSGPCADVPPGGECQSQVKRIHKCRICLSPGHQEKDCPNKWSGKKLKKGRGWEGWVTWVWNCQVCFLDSVWSFLVRARVWTVNVKHCWPVGGGIVNVSFQRIWPNGRWSKLGKGFPPRGSWWRWRRTTWIRSHSSTDWVRGVSTKEKRGAGGKAAGEHAA